MCAHRSNQLLIEFLIIIIGFPSINPHRFGSQFINDVANPSEILQFVKKKNLEKLNKKDMKFTAQGELRNMINEGKK